MLGSVTFAAVSLTMILPNWKTHTDVDFVAFAGRTTEARNYDHIGVLGLISADSCVIFQVDGESVAKLFSLVYPIQYFELGRNAHIADPSSSSQLKFLDHHHSQSTRYETTNIGKHGTEFKPI